mmetsp:Transcript_1060/g.1991  ORF Transcript_1060/g.1991 Transcript_1060/m.1991 type:complete len:153 (+) Transcript_1060:50-508(+)
MSLFMSFIAVLLTLTSATRLEPQASADQLTSEVVDASSGPASLELDLPKGYPVLVTEETTEGWTSKAVKWLAKRVERCWHGTSKKVAKCIYEAINKSFESEVPYSYHVVVGPKSSLGSWHDYDTRATIEWGDWKIAVWALVKGEDSLDSDVD